MKEDINVPLWVIEERIKFIKKNNELKSLEKEEIENFMKDGRGRIRVSDYFKQFLLEDQEFRKSLEEKIDEIITEKRGKYMYDARQVAPPLNVDKLCVIKTEELRKVLREEILEVLTERESDKPTAVSVCCGDYENCNKPCVPRADYWKENSRVELNKLAFSILKKSLKDEGYYESWKANIAMSFYDEYFRNDIKQGMEHLIVHNIANRAADNFLQRLFDSFEDK